MSKPEIYLTHRDVFEFQDGYGKVAFAAKIDKRKLSQLVWKASKNKSGVSCSGPLIVEAKRLP
jgi:hypothetical protein